MFTDEQKELGQQIIDKMVAMPKPDLIEFLKWLKREVDTVGGENYA